MTRQADRLQARERLKAGDAVVRGGLTLEPAPAQLLGLAMQLRNILADTSNAARAADAAELIHRINDTSQRKAADKVAIACTRGCTYCCHTYVSAMAPEVFRVTRAVRAHRLTEPQRLSLIEQLQITAGQSHAERLGGKRPCALLSDGLCSVYAARPAVCRKTASTSLDDCIAVFNGGTAGWTSPRINDVASSASHYALSIALKTQSLDWHSYELSAALIVALSRADAESAWLSGDDVFAGVRRDPRPPDYERNVTLAAAEITR
jgi:Fe-S-cluster containining protein